MDKFHVPCCQGCQRCPELDPGEEKARGEDQDGKKAVFRGRHLLLKRPGNLTPQQAFKLDGILKNDPDLSDAYECEEAFYMIWEAKTKEEAATAIDAWLKAVPKRHEEAFVHAISRDGMVHRDPGLVGS